MLKGLANITLPSNMQGQEKGTRHKAWSKAALRVLLAHPDVYESAAGSTALNILYQLVNRKPTWLAERTFLWSPDWRSKFNSAGVPQFSLESKHAATDFDLLGISMPTELLYPSLVQLLIDAGLSPWSQKRRQSDPLIAVGGVPSFNPLPIAPLIDLAFIGEAEESFVEVLEALEAMPVSTKAEKLLALSRIPGVYVPSVHATEMQVVSKRALRNLSILTELTEPVIPYGWEKKPRASLQVMRGCVWKCRYCQAGFTTLPVRQMAADQVLQTVRDLREYGIDEVGLLALNVIDHPHLPNLLDQLKNERKHVRIPAIKMDYVDPQLVRPLGTDVFSLALEAGSERLRFAINRPYRDTDWHKAVDHILKAGGKRISMDFMLGLPTETDDDVIGIARTVDEVGRLVAGHAEVSASLAAFVPKPHTPFQWHAQVLPDEIRRRHALVQVHLKPMAHVHYHFRNPEPALVEGLLARGSADVAPLIVAAAKAGVVERSWDVRFLSETWLDLATDMGFALADYVQRTFAPTGNLPWDVISVGVQKKYLIREWHRSLEAATLKPEELTWRT